MECRPHLIKLFFNDFIAFSDFHLVHFLQQVLFVLIIRLFFSQFD